MKSLKLFNAVLKKDSDESPFISNKGFIIESNALHQKDEIISFYDKELLGGNDLNKTFHKSWSKIKNSRREEVFIHQIAHYLSTYGTNFKSEIYIPKELLDIPEIEEGVTFKVIKGFTKKEFIEKCFNLLNSGIALKEETIDDILIFLGDTLGYEFTGKENFRNKEAIIKIANLYNVLPKDTMDFFRYIIYRSTQKSLLIKNNEIIDEIKKSNFNPSYQFNLHGLEKLGEIFNRFKPLFLAFKNKCPKTINKISKLSKKYHKPMIFNPLNNVTNIKLDDSVKHWLDNATPYSLFKALNACYTRKNGQDTYLYKIRNGKSWVKEKESSTVSNFNFKHILNYLKERYNLEGEKFYIPKHIVYSLPTSEKMFVGNVPSGTKILGSKLAVGIYWENEWGANDLDLSGLNIGGKIAWNSEYNQNNGDLMYSGDITSAPKGAVEYLYARNGLKEPTLVLNNVFSGDEHTTYKIIVGKGDKISRDYMMNPNNLIFETKCQSVQKNTIIGLIMPYKNKQSFTLMNLGSGNARVSGNNKISQMVTKSLYQEYSNQYTFNKLIKALGGKLVNKKEEADYDFSIESLTKDCFINIF